MSNQLENDRRLKSLCRVGEGERCCRWLARGWNGYFCAKLDRGVAPYIAERFAAGTLGAKGDNCPGLPLDEKPTP